MGCDIHMYAERRVDGKWRPLFEPVGDEYYGYEWPVVTKDRDYDLFGVLAGVRNRHVPCITGEPRGLPCDLCEEYARAHAIVYSLSLGAWSKESPHCCLGEHSFSWLSLAELVVAGYDRRYRPHLEHFFRNEVQRLLDQSDCLGVNIEDVRVVFGFDS